jgi:hypothetical protein
MKIKSEHRFTPVPRASFGSPISRLPPFWELRTV